MSDNWAVCAGLLVLYGIPLCLLYIGITKKSYLLATMGIIWIIFATVYVHRKYAHIPGEDAADTLDIYAPIDTLKQLDNATIIYNKEEVSKYAECPYCGSNIRDTFYEHGGIVRCDKCGAFHHKECFEYYGNKCGSSSCKLRNT